MKFRKVLSNRLAVSVRFALSISALVAVVPVFAQAGNSDQGRPETAKKLETVTVTGSRIPRVDMETAQPVLTIDRAQIEKQGAASVADLLQNLTEAGSPTISRANALSSGEDVGGYYIDLRNIGSTRTLVLLNGKRLGATTSGRQDLGQIPASAIDRIEILKDGASSVYGSDAIGGVVNVITRKNFKGAEANAYLGQYGQGDGAAQVYDFSLGTSNERSSLMLSVQQYKEDPVWAKDRSYSRYPNGSRYPTTGWSLVSQNGAFSGLCGAGGDPAWCTLTKGSDPRDIANYRPLAPSERTNFAEQMMLQTGLERTSVFVSGHYDVASNVRFNGELLYNKRSTRQQIAGYPFSTGGFDMPLSGESYFNPIGKDVAFLRRGWEVPRTTNSELESFRFVAGFEGGFDIGDRLWNWDVSALHNRNDLLKTGHGDFNLVHARNAVGPSYLGSDGKVHCGTSASPVSDCVPWNPLLPYGQAGHGSLADPALQTYLFPEFHDTGRTTTTMYSANLAGSLFSLPAGDVGMAIGYEYRREQGRFAPDAFNQSGLSSGLPATGTSGKYAVNEGYVEFDVPVLSDKAFARELSLNAATRHSRYSNFGNTTNSKFGVKWKPMDDLLVRGSWSQGFRAPSIDNLYGGANGTFAFYTDPCDTVSGSAKGNGSVAARCSSGFGGQAVLSPGFVQLGQGGSPCTSYPCQTNYQFISGSNDKLRPETATTRTLGLVYSPSYAQGFDVSLDWYKIRIDNSISTDSVTDILEDCYLRGITARCSSFTRDPSTGAITSMFFGLTNKGWLETAGYDIGVNYRLPKFSFGQFKLQWNTTYVDYLNEKSDNNPDTKVQPLNSYAGNFRVRSNVMLDWALGDFGANWSMRYYSGMKERCVAVAMAECNDRNHVAPDTGARPLRRVASTIFNDMQFRWNAPWNATIALGANNVFDKVGPTMYSQPNSAFPYYGGFDIGRFYYLKYQQRF
ncbi:TonB-dependent receptor plug domain-containing protein [Dyella tabacisoli]|uniref:TonB-dependent receptor n=1 Tax=Dyella tabacisoli TaxID=2282381 RepID=A0A369UL36_9GAMM|nr:TonB-dependent receptor [Dyella tabacisoli]RDD80795.1 TonB-dependent receptor [Dyella tabacisoli]